MSGSLVIDGNDNIRRSKASISSSCWRVGSWPVGTGAVMASSLLDVGGVLPTAECTPKGLPKETRVFPVSDRFFFDDTLSSGSHVRPKAGDSVELDGPEAHHLSSVRRFKEGDFVTLFNGDGNEYPARIVDVEKKRIRLQIASVERPERELSFRLHIASALPKGDRGDFLIEKLTELGATDFTPLITERSVVKADDAKAEKIRRAVIESSKQCGRNVLMRVHPPVRWLEWCVKQPGLRLLALPTVIVELAAGGEDAIVAIGPEGGFSESEIQAALNSGWVGFSLGPRVLRTETAGIVAAARLGRSN